MYIQTFTPTHAVIQALKTFDRDTFLSLELHNRETGNLPPFSRQTSLVITGDTEEHVKYVCNQLLQKAPQNHDIMVFGPAPAILMKLRGKFRYRFLLQSSKQTLLQPYVYDWLHAVNVPKTIKLTIDIDPISFY